MSDIMITKKTALYSVLHMFVDGICAFAMLGFFAGSDYTFPVFLVYNFCAFVLQLPIGIFLDGILLKYHKCSYIEYIPYIFAAAGIVITIAGAFVSPVILGTGNALYHVGGGVDTIREDYMLGKRGVLLGIFVAPGALGLYIGGQMAGMCTEYVLYVIAAGGMAAILLVILLVVIYKKYCDYNIENGYRSIEYSCTQEGIHSSRNMYNKRYSYILIICCFMVVVLRSYSGLGITMAWKSGAGMSVAAVMAVVLGKMSGGVLSAVYGTGRVVIISLIVAALCYIFSDNAFFGVVALYTFNMTMPVTLYLLVDRFRIYRGFFFGLLTVALYAGYLPAYYNIKFPVSDSYVAAGISAVSLILLVIAVYYLKRYMNDGADERS